MLIVDYFYTFPLSKDKHNFNEIPFDDVMASFALPLLDGLEKLLAL